MVESWNSCNKWGIKAMFLESTKRPCLVRFLFWREYFDHSSGCCKRCYMIFHTNGSARLSCDVIFSSSRCLWDKNKLSCYILLKIDELVAKTALWACSVPPDVFMVTSKLMFSLSFRERYMWEDFLTRDCTDATDRQFEDASPPWALGIEQGKEQQRAISDW